MNEKGHSCFPSIDTLQKETALARPTIIKYLDIAQSEGWITKEQRGLRGKRWKRNEYSAKIPQAFYEDEGGKRDELPEGGKGSKPDLPPDDEGGKRGDEGGKRGELEDVIEGVREKKQQQEERATPSKIDLSFLGDQESLYGDQVRAVLSKVPDPDPYAIVRTVFPRDYQTQQWHTATTLHKQYGWVQFVAALVVTADNAKRPSMNYAASVLRGFGNPKHRRVTDDYMPKATDFIDEFAR